MKLFNLALTIVFVIGFISCSGMVQTNPVPNPTKYVLPKISNADLNTTVAEKDINDFDAYAKEFFQVNVIDYKKTIWSIGLSRGHYDQNSD